MTTMASARPSASCSPTRDTVLSASPAGKAALDYLRSTGLHPCVILLDLMMPVMDGETFRREQLADPALREIPVLLITAAGREAAARVPADGVLLKPVSLDDTLAAVARHCPRKEAGGGRS